MTQLILKNFELTSKKKQPENIDFFHELVDVYITQSAVIHKYQLAIISCKYLETKFLDIDKAKYLKSCLVLNYYDEETIKKNIQQIIKLCREYKDKHARSCLGYYLYEIK